MILFKKYYNRMFLNDVRRIIEEYNMIEDGDRVAVGLSGGKDSITLLFILKLLQKYSNKNFELCGINIDLGFDMDMTLLENYCRENEIELIIEKTNIGEVIFEDRKEKNPCSLCSKLRKGALYRVAIANGYNKVALGHSSDDAIETFFMNMLCVGKLGTFHPCIKFEEKGITVIRPMVYVKEKTIKSIVEMEQLPVIESNCPVAGKTKRQEMKELLADMEEVYKDLHDKIITALQNIDTEKMWKQKR
ncbi:potassium-transporting ATPase subunit C [Fervidicella metallireducens AeB]|uniref:Potassium-transporting ATPase subunit C n=1 Tax=Fervidicella metallireducens AeB TaxID=1403537 RepID=A0A017S075_9CLOT|nr:ATP-binding protein [Fervidicella metallireducens]EYE89545.1 potassium-transporting ATPase subunit C [Fervidicella metallireducens AeB]